MTEMLQIGRVPPAVSGQAFRSAKSALRVQASALLVLVDFAAVLLGTLTPVMLGFPVPAHAGFDLPLLVAVAYVGVALVRRAYGYRVLEAVVRGIVRALGALAITLILVFALIFYLHASEAVSRLAISVGAICASAFLIVGRLAVASLLRMVFPDGLTNKLVLCDGVIRAPRAGEIVIPMKEHGLRPCADDPLMLDRLGRLARNADRVIVICPPDDRVSWAHVLKGLGIDIEVLMPEFDALGMLGIESFDGVRTAVVGRGPMGPRDRLFKRAFDLLFVFLVLPPVLLLTGIVAIAIKLDDGGPVFFLQHRVGEGNRLFRICKFRTMSVHRADPDGVRSASRTDDRITRVGRVLRVTSIDEIPQIFNVLKGEMSIVGPRPHALRSTAESRLFWEVDRRYWHRHAARPGMTGLAQIRGFRGATAERRDLVDRLQADLEYVSSWSVWQDLRIILATCRVMFHHKAF